MNEPEYKRPTKTILFIAFMGVLLPIAALAVEATVRIFSGAFFDPLPTFYHGVMIATVPLANALLAVSLHRGRPFRHPGWAWLHAFATGTALLYSLLFLPLAPFGVLAIVFYGIGLLPLAPLLSLAAALFGRAGLKRMTGAAPRYLWQGMALALAAFMLLDAPPALTRFGMHFATSDSKQTSMRGVRLLRAAGTEELMLRYCHPRAGVYSGMLGGLLDLHTTVNPEEARAVFYRVTGTPFNSRPAPAARAHRMQDIFDNDRGGEKVGQQAAGVVLESSRMDGSIDANAALAYLEWTMVFRNESSQQQEGRAEVMLPPGAVVSRATLWIGDEEREAAFGSRGKVRQAYESVVRANRDPLLVTTAGPDRVLVQLFPIPPGGNMKIRIGMTAPMAMHDLRRARLQLPSFSERNFTIAPSLRHAVWVESASPLQGGPGLLAQAVNEKLFAVRGGLAEPAPGEGASGIEVARVGQATLAWSADPKGSDGKIVVQTLSERPVAAPRRVALVLDGSLSMRVHQARLAEALASLPYAGELALVHAGDDAPVVFRHDPSDSPATRRYVEGLDFVGGRDNKAALGAAWDWAAQVQGSSIVWVHGAQPESMEDLDPLLQRFERRPGQVALVDVEAAAGPNAVAKKLDGVALIHRAPRAGSLQDDLRRLFGQWQPGATQVALVRERRPAGAMPDAGKTSAHLARLWAAGEVTALGGAAAKREAAVALATRYQLVTPVSGAVVLETQKQYDAAGLNPVPPGSVPTIPEPETWLLMIVALAVLAWRKRARA